MAEKDIDMINRNTDTSDDARRDKIRGCIYGGAVGDALGYPVEFWDEETIFAEYGTQGITAFRPDWKTGKALISDDTQMTLFTANGVIVGDTRGKMRGLAAVVPREYVARAYMDWLMTQENSFKAVSRQESLEDQRGCSWLLDVPELYNRRAPGRTCISALREGIGSSDYVLEKRNDSKGCGGIMRVAPLAVFYGAPHDIEQIDLEGAQLAAITHGHSLGYMPAAVLVHIINRIIYPRRDAGMPLKDIILEAADTAGRLFAGDEHLLELRDIINRAVDLAENGPEDDLANIHRLGEGWVAEETLGISLYCALRHQDDFSAGVTAAVNHNGDSDSTGAVTGNILGAINGYRALDKKWKEKLELSDIILEMADDLYTGCPMSEYDSCRDPVWEEKYIRMHRPAQKESENE